MHKLYFVNLFEEMHYSMFYVEIQHLSHILLFVPGNTLIYVVLFVPGNTLICVVLFIKAKHTTFILYVFFPQNNFFLCYTQIISAADFKICYSCEQYSLPPSLPPSSSLPPPRGVNSEGNWLSFFPLS
jgi:hypothetical protein